MLPGGAAFALAGVRPSQEAHYHRVLTVRLQWKGAAQKLGAAFAKTAFLTVVNSIQLSPP
jgi:hypothetical protein